MINKNIDNTELFARTKKAEVYAEECLAEAALYKNELEEAYKALQRISRSNDISVIKKIANNSSVVLPFENDVKKWGELLLDSANNNAVWLEDAKTSLKQIKNYANDITDKELKNKILKEVENGLITHMINRKEGSFVAEVETLSDS